MKKATLMETKLHNQKLFKTVSSILNLTGFRSNMKNSSCYEMPTNNVNPNKPYFKASQVGGICGIV